MSLFGLEAESLQRALEEGAHPDELDADGCTPLMRAAEAGRVDVLATLLEAGADPEVEDRLGETAFLKAAGTGNVEAYALLVPYCRNADQRALAETMLRTVSGTSEIPRPEEVTADSKWAGRLASAGAKLGSWFGDNDPTRRLERLKRARGK